MQLRQQLTARRTLNVAAALLPMLAACASARPFSAANEPPRDVLRVTADDRTTGARVVLSGAPVQLVNGGGQAAQDTVFTTAPISVALPAEAFELRIAARDDRGRAANADIELSIPDAAGVAHVRATGSELVVRRATAGAAIEVVGATRPVAVSRVARNG